MYIVCDAKETIEMDIILLFFELIQYPDGGIIVLKVHIVVLSYVADIIFY